MKAAIDIDGTLMAWPQVLGPLSVALDAAGWEVCLLTGAISAPVGQAGLYAMKTAAMEKVRGIVGGWKDVVVVVGTSNAEVASAKGQYLAANQVDLFIDDDTPAAQVARAVSPKTLTLGVWP